MNLDQPMMEYRRQILEKEIGDRVIGSNIPRGLMAHGKQGPAVSGPMLGHSAPRSKEDGEVSCENRPTSMSMYAFI